MSGNSHKSKIGGQALIEGIMMRGLDKGSMAVRLPNGEIDVETWAMGSIAKPKWYRKIPVIRGVINFVESIIQGYKCLMKSAEKSGMADLEEEELSPFEKKLNNLLGEKLSTAITVTASVIGVVLSILLFMYLPALAAKGIGSVVNLGAGRALVEGLIKIILFITYLFLVSKMKDIQRVFAYHGAEHKTIACYEAGEELTVENVKKHSRFHPRCGTSFLLIVLVISILVFSLPVFTWENMVVRTVTKLAFLPLLVGISYELIKIAGRYENPVTKIISAPGLWLQRLTTNEPDDSQIEVGIAAVTPVLPEDKSQDNW